MQWISRSRCCGVDKNRRQDCRQNAPDDWKCKSVPQGVATPIICCCSSSSVPFWQVKRALKLQHRGQARWSICKAPLSNLLRCDVR
eukprot:9464740-Karenia_brevis.AAC.1